MRLNNASLLVRRRVNEWDPVDLISIGAPEDEYDCITTPLVGFLSRRAEEAEITAWLRQFIVDDFNQPCPPDVADFVSGLVREWTSSDFRTTEGR